MTEAGRCGEDEVALGDDFEGGGEVGDAQGDAPLQALCVEDAVDDAGALASWGDEDVIKAGVLMVGLSGRGFGVHEFGKNDVKQAAADPDWQGGIGRERQ